MDSKLLTADLDKMMRKEVNYCCAKENTIQDKIRSVMDDLNKGVILPAMDRGTGKTAFANRNDCRYSDDSLLSSPSKHVEVRTYSARDSVLRGTQDFVSTVNSCFTYSCRYNGIRFNGITPPVFKLDKETSAASLASLLSFYKKFLDQGKDSIVLIIDGVDELDAQSSEILDAIPSRDQMTDGTFVLLTVRNENPDEEEPQNSGISRRIADRCRKLADQHVVIHRDDRENIGMLLTFI